MHVGLQFLSVVCVIYLSLFEEYVSFQLKITQKNWGCGVIYICTVLVVACRD